MSALGPNWRGIARSRPAQQFLQANRVATLKLATSSSHECCPIMRRVLSAVLGLSTLVMHPEGSSAQEATLAVVNARVWTGDQRRPWADALATAGDRILVVGSGAEVRKLAGPTTRVIDARGMMLVPG